MGNIYCCEDKYNTPISENNQLAPNNSTSIALVNAPRSPAKREPNANQSPNITPTEALPLIEKLSTSNSNPSRRSNRTNDDMTGGSNMSNSSMNDSQVSVPLQDRNSLPKADTWHSNAPEDFIQRDIETIRLTFPDHYSNQCVLCGRPTDRNEAQLFFSFDGEELLANCKIIIHQEMENKDSDLIKIDIIGYPIQGFKYTQLSRMSIWLDENVYNEYIEDLEWIMKEQRSKKLHKNSSDKNTVYFFQVFAFDQDEPTTTWLLHFCRKVDNKKQWDLYANAKLYMNDVKINSVNTRTVEVAGVKPGCVTSTNFEFDIPQVGEHENGKTQHQLRFIRKLLDKVGVNLEIQTEGLKIVNWNALNQDNMLSNTMMESDMDRTASRPTFLGRTSKQFSTSHFFNRA